VFRTIFGTIIDLRIPKKAGDFKKTIGRYVLKGDDDFRYE
jgi:hypothetical protein